MEKITQLLRVTFADQTNKQTNKQTRRQRLVRKMRARTGLQRAKLMWTVFLVCLAQSRAFSVSRHWSSPRNCISLAASADNLRNEVKPPSNSSSLVTVHTNILDYVGVAPFLIFKDHPVRKRLSFFTWKTRGWVLRIVHARDPLKPPNSCINLECLWYKALAANNRTSPIFDDGLTHDLLPRFSRILVARPFHRFYPRLVHGRLEIRSAYLEQAIQKEIDHVRRQRVLSTAATETLEEPNNVKIRIIYMGAGYETRSVKLLSQGLVDECIDMDLPEVIAMKQLLFTSRLRPRRPELTDQHFPKMIGLDLNNVDILRDHLREILNTTSRTDIQSGASEWYNIFVAEGVLMYLKPGNSRRVLETCAQEVANSHQNLASLCFADKLNITSLDTGDCEEELAKASWQLVDWAPNPYINAKHIGTARLLTKRPEM